MKTLLIFWILWIGMSCSVHAQPSVLVTIKPLHSLVSGVMKGVATPYLLLQGGESPHSYSLRPSDMQRLQSAQLLVWNGPGLETFLSRIVTNLPAQTMLMTVQDQPGLTLLTVRARGLWHTEHDNREYHHHAVGILDPHLWLNPQNAIVIVRAVAAQLVELDAGHAETYLRNADALIKRLMQLDSKLAQQLKSVQSLSFVVFHDAYQYFGKHYALQMIGSLHLSPEQPIHPLHLQAIQDYMKANQVACIFTEPQFTPAIAENLAADTGTRLGKLDPIGAGLTAGTDMYFVLLNNLADSLRQCLIP